MAQKREIRIGGGNDRRQECHAIIYFSCSSSWEDSNSYNDNENAIDSTITPLAIYIPSNTSLSGSSNDRREECHAIISFSCSSSWEDSNSYIDNDNAIDNTIPLAIYIPSNTSLSNNNKNSISGNKHSRSEEPSSIDGSHAEKPKTVVPLEHDDEISGVTGSDEKWKSDIRKILKELLKMMDMTHNEGRYEI